MYADSVARKRLLAIIIILGSAIAARFTIGLLYFNSYDTYWYRQWAFSLPEGFFNVYARAEEISLDYPPLYLFCLYLTGLAYRFFGYGCSDLLQMFLMKFWPIIFDSACVFMIYFAAKKYSHTAALFAAALWACNPSAIYNCSFWGQTDGLMAFLLLAAFYLANSKKPVWACVVFAVAGLTKYQSLFFTPVLLIYIFKRYDLKKFLYGILSAAGTVAGVFLPFMIGARDPWLFFRVYLGGAGTYKYCTFNAYNIYGLFGMNVVKDSTTIIGGFNFAHLNFIIIAIIVLSVVFFYIRGVRTDIYVGGLFIMQSIFILGTRMHERYQMVVLPFALMAYVSTRNRHFAWQFSLLTVLTLINQSVILYNVNIDGIFYEAYRLQIMQIVSAANVAVYAHTVYATVQFFFKGDKVNDLLETKTSLAPPAEEQSA